MTTQNALTHLHSYLSNFVPCCPGSNAPEIADEFYGLSGTIAEFLSLVKDEIFVSGYATAIDLGKIYSDVQEYLEFWQAQAACHAPSYTERYTIVASGLASFARAMATFLSTDTGMHACQCYAQWEKQGELFGEYHTIYSSVVLQALSTVETRIARYEGSTLRSIRMDSMKVL